MPIELLSPEERNRRNYVYKCTRAGNRTLNRRTQPNAREFVTLLGYHAVVTCYSQGNGGVPFSGGTYNRYENKRRKDEIQKLAEEKKAVEERLRKTSPWRFESESETEYLCTDQADQSIVKPKVSKSLFKRGNALRFLSTRSKGKIRDKGAAFSRCLGKRQTFATLTFINDVRDSDAVRILNKFFTAIRKEYKRFQYWWVAERQDNGRIHFHIILNKFLPVERWNGLWVLMQYNNGIEYPGLSYRKVVSLIESGDLKKYLNPFTIKAIHNIYGLSYYLTKYVTKNKNQGFGCAAWHCSRGVSRLFTKATVSRSTFSEAGSFVNTRVSKKTGEVFTPKVVIGCFHQLYYIHNKLHFLPMMCEMEEVNGYIINSEIDFEGIRRCLN